MTYYVNHNACDTLEDAEEVVQMYRAAGVPAEVITEEEYFEQLERSNSVVALDKQVLAQ